jgi:TolB-like protein
MRNRIYSLILLVLAGAFASGCATLTAKQQDQWDWLIKNKIITGPKEYKKPGAAAVFNLIGGLAELSYLDMDDKAPGGYQMTCCVLLGPAFPISWCWSIPLAIHNTRIANMQHTIKAHLYEIPIDLGGDADIPVGKPKKTRKPKEIPPDLTAKPKDFEPLPEEQRPRLAVFNFEDKSPAGKSDYGSIVADLFHTSLYQTECFRLIEREQIRKVLLEQDFGNTERVSEDAAVQIGKLLKVEYILIGSIAKLGTKFVITARVINVSRGDTAAAAPTKKANSAEEIDTVVNSMATFLGAKFR